MGSSPISSRKSVPPSAAAMRPRRALVAPVNAPLTWPNSSLSRSASGIAPQLTGTSAFAARGLRAWMRRANTSLPTPVSPVMRTVASLAAMRWQVRARSWMGEAGPGMRPVLSARVGGERAALIVAMVCLPPQPLSKGRASTSDRWRQRRNAGLQRAGKLTGMESRGPPGRGATSWGPSPVAGCTAVTGRAPPPPPASPRPPPPPPRRAGRSGAGPLQEIQGMGSDAPLSPFQAPHQKILAEIAVGVAAVRRGGEVEPVNDAARRLLCGSDGEALAALVARLATAADGARGDVFEAGPDAGGGGVGGVLG